MSGRIAIVILLTFWTSLILPKSGTGQERGADGNDEQVLARGPIHEAFAQPVVFDPKPGLTVKKQPPKNIEEMPPEQKPEGDDVQWISGYWSWDDERDDYIWVSGLWRNIPAGMEWTPGYWAQTDGGWQWITGYWARADVRQIEYLPEPPPAEEHGPSSESPGADHIWSPGCWVWHQTRYVWRPGHWFHDHPGWTWCPSHYVYTPRGYIFVDGYWDYSFRRRGVIFAPVYFTAGVFHRPRFIYSPSVVIDIDIVVNHCFVWPRYRHYVFGDYYAAGYVNSGIYPWFSFHMSRFGYSPIFAYYHRHYHRSDPDWGDRLRDRYRYFQTHERHRPARTFDAQAALVSRVQGDPSARQQIDTASLKLAKPLREAVAERRDRQFERIDEARRTQIVERQKDLQQARDKRSELESKGGDALPGRQQQPLKVERPKTPITVAAPPSERRDRTSPPPPTAPRVDPAAKPPAKRGEGLPPPESQIDKRRDRGDPPSKTQPPRDPPAKTEGRLPAKVDPTPPPKGPPAKTEPPRRDPPAKTEGRPPAKVDPTPPPKGPPAKTEPPRRDPPVKTEPPPRRDPTAKTEPPPRRDPPAKTENRPPPKADPMPPPKGPPPKSESRPPPKGPPPKSESKPPPRGEGEKKPREDEAKKPPASSP